MVLLVCLQRVVTCSCRNLLPGEVLTSQPHDLGGEIIEANFPFSGQERQAVCLLYFTSRKSIAEGFLLGDLCFMKFMPGGREAGWGAGNHHSGFLPSAALIVCNDLISNTKQGKLILPCSKCRRVAIY